MAVLILLYATPIPGDVGVTVECHPVSWEMAVLILLYATPVPGDVGMTVECHPMSWGMAVVIPLHSILYLVMSTPTVSFRTTVSHLSE